MKKCINCGNRENNNASVCSRCGGALVKDSKICWRCGVEVDGDVAFCNNCGAALANDTPADPYLYERASVPAPEKKSKGKGVVIALSIVISVLLIVCIVLAVYLISDKRDNSAQNGNDNRQQQEQFRSEEENGDDEKPKISAYDVYKSDYTWTEANSAAMQMGGNLICVNSYDEFLKACEMADSRNIKVFWMGASLDYGGQSWYDVSWNNGDEITYTKWYSNEPSYYENDVPEKYLMAFKVDGEWYFNDSVNDVSSYYAGKMGYIVEFEE